MRGDWEKKPFREVADVIGGSTPKTNVAEYWGGTNYWVSPAELDGSKYIERTARCITDVAVEKTHLTRLPSGTVLLSSRAPIGKVCITKTPMYCNQGFKNIICGPSLYNEFVYYFLKHNTAYLNSLGTGATFKEISKKVVENIQISYPSISEQERIVEELDLLQSIIDNKKEQLKELDKLAQSIFYEMFGDPKINDKGYETKALKQLCTALFAGGDVPKDRCSEERTDEFRIPIVSNGIGVKSIYGYTDKARVFDTSVSISGRGTIGYCEVRNEPFFPVVRLIVATPNKKDLLPIVLKYIIDALELKGTGGTIPQLTIPMIRDILIPLIPICEQSIFSEKIEQIEKQKNLIQQSIKETQTLFNSRMDYYFN